MVDVYQPCSVPPALPKINTSIMIEPMSKFDWSDLDAHLLQLLVAIVDTGSITGAAQRLGVTQSAVSHLLDKLRAITGDRLFVKSGRGIVATARAEALWRGVAGDGVTWLLMMRSLATG